MAKEPSVCSKFRKGFDINSTTWCYFRMIYTFRHVPRVNRCNRMPFSSARKHSFNEMSEWFIPRYTRGKSREKNFSVWVICRKTFFFQSPSSATMGSEKLRQFTLTTFSKTTQERRRRKQAGKLMLFALHILLFRLPFSLLINELRNCLYFFPYTQLLSTT